MSAVVTWRCDICGAETSLDFDKSAAAVPPGWHYRFQTGQDACDKHEVTE